MKSKKTNYKKKVRKYLAVPVAFATVFTTSAYGISHLLDSLQEPVKNVITVLLVAFICYTIFLVEE